MWFKDIRSKTFPVSGPMLQENTADLAKGLCVDDFVGGSRWLECLKNGMIFVSVCCVVTILSFH